MSRLSLRDLVIAKERPQTTLSLVPAFRRHAEQMVGTYILTDTIRARFEEILESVTRGHGQGFWVQAEYGAGKTHFLVALAALLSAPDGGLWELVDDDAVRNYRRRMGGMRLFPVVLSLRGEGSADAYVERSLLDVLLEEGFQRSLEHMGLEDQVQVTAAEDLWNWLRAKAGQGIRQDAEAFVHRQEGRALEAYRDDEGIEAAGRLISAYCEDASIRPEIVTSVKARLTHIYRQIAETDGLGYDGLLVVIDEYEGWEKNHNSKEELSADAELLETLGYLLPRDLGCRVFTIVASQSAVPAKLRGEQEGDRFINIPLLAQENERDYDVIISRRVRGLNEERMPEINDHYEYCTQNFAFAKNLTIDEFHDIFPFQPRCFEVVRRITARDLPTTRSGLFVFWEAVTQSDLLDRTLLIRVADMLASDHLVEDCLTTTVYREAYQAYRVAREALDVFDLEPDDLSLAKDVLSTLFLWYLAHMEAPRRMSLEEIAEATLTTDDLLRAPDNVAYVLSLVQALDQIDFDSESAQFVPTGGDGLSVITIFNEEKRRALRDRYKLQTAWTDSLFFKPQDTGGVAGLFHEFPTEENVTRRVQSRHLEYSGQVIVATGGRMDYGSSWATGDMHFRVVVFTPVVAHMVQSKDLEDPRIAVILPGEMTNETREAAAGHVAWNAMQEKYEGRTGRDAEEVRSWLDAQRRSVLDALADTHLKLYQAGRILTRDDLAIQARDVFGRGGGNDTRITYVVDQLLTHAYPQLPVEADRFRGTLTPTEVGKVFAGYFDPNPRPAARSALRNYGTALGLSHSDRPEHFAPQSPRTFELVEEMLKEQGGAELPIWKLYDRLSAMPYGLPYAVIQLYLLAFVRRGSPRVDLLLKARHRLQNRGGQSIDRNRLTAGTVVDLRWKPGLESGLNALVEAVGPTWNDTLGYAREVVDDLQATTDQARIEEMNARLCGELEKLGRVVGAQRRNLQALAGTLGADLPGEADSALGRLQQLTNELPASYVDFYERVEEVFPTSADLRLDMQIFARLRSLTDVAAEIGTTRRYLDDVMLAQGERDLVADRMTLSAQLNLETLVRRPDTWDRLHEDFEQFRRLYQNAYQKHHRDYYKALARLRDDLDDVPRRLEALGLLNRIEGLGAALGDDLKGHYEVLRGRLDPCPVNRVTDVKVEHGPTCDQCPQPLRVTDDPPEASVKAFLHDLDRALDDKRRQLASEAISRVLAQGDRDDLTTFLEAVRASDLAALVDVMSPELADFIERVLADEAILTAEADVLDLLAQRFPSLEESQIDSVVAAFQCLLKEAFADARAAHPDKRTVRLSLR